MADAITTLEHEQKLPGGFFLPARTTVVRTEGGGLALISPVPIDDRRAAELARLGEVRWLVAPNLLHHLYLAEAHARYPDARVIAPRGLATKRPDLRIDATLDGPLPPELAACLDVLPIGGAPLVDEHLFFHRPTRTLVVTDLVFHVTEPRGLVTHLVLWLVGCHRRLAQSRSWRFFVRDRAAYASSLAPVLALDTETLVVAHGEVVREDARARLARALAPLLGRSHPALREAAAR